MVVLGIQQLNTFQSRSDIIPDTLRSSSIWSTAEGTEVLAQAYILLPFVVRAQNVRATDHYQLAHRSGQGHIESLKIKKKYVLNDKLSSRVYYFCQINSVKESIVIFLIHIYEMGYFLTHSEMFLPENGKKK